MPLSFSIFALLRVSCRFALFKIVLLIGCVSTSRGSASFRASICKVPPVLKMKALYVAVPINSGRAP